MLPSPTQRGGSASLASAFAAFTASADALQHAYGEWTGEIASLRQQLKEKDSELAHERAVAEHLRALSEVAGVLAHEVKNSVASMELFSGMLADLPDLRDEAREWVAHLQAGCRRVTSTVNNVLHFYSGRRVHHTKLAIGETLRHATDFIRPMVSSSNVSLRFCDRSAGATVVGNGDQLSQVVLNLALNSIAALAGEHGLVQISVGSGDSTLRIEVEDSGPGIPADLAPSLFRLGVTSRPGSAGIGLAVCERIVTEHGGSIRLEGADRCGARFVISLPRCAE